MSGYKWDYKSATRKAVSGIHINVSTPTPFISVSKSIGSTPPHDPEKDAYRNCAICGRHWNFHSSGKCPINKKKK
jgi:hypothetical protein